MTGLSESTLTAATTIPSTSCWAMSAWMTASWCSAAPVGGPCRSTSTPSWSIACSTPTRWAAVYGLDRSFVMYTNLSVLPCSTCSLMYGASSKATAAALGSADTTSESPGAVGGVDAPAVVAAPTLQIAAKPATMIAAERRVDFPIIGVPLSGSSRKRPSLLDAPAAVVHD